MHGFYYIIITWLPTYRGVEPIFFLSAPALGIFKNRLCLPAPTLNWSQANLFHVNLFFWDPDSYFLYHFLRKIRKICSFFAILRHFLVGSGAGVFRLLSPKKTSAPHPQNYCLAGSGYLACRIFLGSEYPTCWIQKVLRMGGQSGCSKKISPL